MPTLLNDRYRILNPLGAGGFGNTFLAEDTHLPSKRRCVIKQLKPIANDPHAEQQVRSRFDREAAVLEDLGDRHPQIPRLFAYFSEQEQFYLVQEYIEGQTLTQKLQNQPFNETQIRQLLLDTLPVLEFVHAQQIVHRDIKPDNIILRDRDNLPVLIDFGAIKEAVTPTGSGPSIVIGTPGFMPPEQAAGRVTYSSDLYALALTAIFLLTGKLPSQLGSDPQSGHLQWRSHAGNISAELTTLLDRAIYPQPQQRFATASEMLAALQTQPGRSQMATVAVGSPGGTVSTSTKSSSRSFPWIAAIPIVVAIVITLGLARGFSNRPQSRTPPSTVPEPETDRRVDSEDPSPTPTPSEGEPSEGEGPSPLQPTPTPTTTTTVTPTPTPTPIPKPTPSPRVETTPVPDIPSFSPGTQQQAIEFALGEPTQVSRGYWGDTRSLLYRDYVPGRVNLAYLVDRSSGRVRQTEASFAPSVELETIAETLNGMMNRNASDEVLAALEDVYRDRIPQYQFSDGRNLEGTIEWDGEGKLYIGVWEADLH